jgi:hypothetical protein
LKASFSITNSTWYLQQQTLLSFKDFTKYGFKEMKEVCPILTSGCATLNLS